MTKNFTVEYTRPGQAPWYLADYSLIPKGGSDFTETKSKAMRMTKSMATQNVANAMTRSPGLTATVINL